MTVQLSKAMQGYGSDFIRDMFAAARNPDLISFAGGAPAPEGYPLEAFRTASDKAFEEWGQVMMAYEGILIEQRPDLVIVVGDVNSTVACTLAAVNDLHAQSGSRASLLWCWTAFLHWRPPGPTGDAGYF